MCVAILRRPRVIAWRTRKRVDHFRRSRAATRASAATAKHARALALSIGIALMQRIATEHRMLGWEDVANNSFTYTAIAAADALLYAMGR